MDQDKLNDENFERAFCYLLLNEGGYVNNSLDRGGPTKWGITLRTLSMWRNRPVSAVDVQNMPREEAKAIYLDGYWLPLKAYKINSLPIATVLFDASVLFGLSISVIIAQRSLQTLGLTLITDGIVGPVTLAALNGVDESKFLKAFVLGLRTRTGEIVTRNPSQHVFELGWENRIAKIMQFIS